MVGSATKLYPWVASVVAVLLLYKALPEAICSPQRPITPKGDNQEHRTTAGNYTTKRPPFFLFFDKWHSKDSGRRSRKNMPPSRVRVEVGVGCLKSEIVEYPKKYFEGKLKHLLQLQQKQKPSRISPKTYHAFYLCPTDILLPKNRSDVFLER